MKCPEKDCGGDLVDLGKTPRNDQEWMCDYCGKKFTEGDLEKSKPSK